MPTGLDGGLLDPVRQVFEDLPQARECQGQVAGHVIAGRGGDCAAALLQGRLNSTQIAELAEGLRRLADLPDEVMSATAQQVEAFDPEPAEQ